MIKVLKLQSWLGRRTGGEFSAEEKCSEPGGDHSVPLLHPSWSVRFCLSLERYYVPCAFSCMSHAFPWYLLAG